ncbi:hypothetical protein [Nostoc sp.]
MFCIKFSRYWGLGIGDWYWVLGTGDWYWVLGIGYWVLTFNSYSLVPSP